MTLTLREVEVLDRKATSKRVVREIKYLTLRKLGSTIRALIQI
jgi:hypothetical protein